MGKRAKLSESDSVDEETSPLSSQPTGPAVKENKEGERYWELGGKKRITLRSWQGKKLVDIREFYGDDNDDLKPGKKGISLNMDQFARLLAAVQEIEAESKNKI